MAYDQRRFKPRKICIIPECGRPQEGQGLCPPHYMRMRLYGSPRPEIPIKSKRKLSLDVAKEMREKYRNDSTQGKARKVTYKSLAKEYGVVYQTVASVIRGYYYKE